VGRVICWFNFGGLVAHERVLRSMRLFAERVIPEFARRENNHALSSIGARRFMREIDRVEKETRAACDRSTSR